jgi:hypothetical protein
MNISDLLLLMVRYKLWLAVLSIAFSGIFWSVISKVVRNYDGVVLSSSGTFTGDALFKNFTTNFMAQNEEVEKQLGILRETREERGGIAYFFESTSPVEVTERLFFATQSLPAVLFSSLSDDLNRYESQILKTRRAELILKNSRLAIELNNLSNKHKAFVSQPLKERTAGQRQNMMMFFDKNVGGNSTDFSNVPFYLLERDAAENAIIAALSEVTLSIQQNGQQVQLVDDYLKSGVSSEELGRIFDAAKTELLTKFDFKVTSVQDMSFDYSRLGKMVLFSVAVGVMAAFFLVYTIAVFQRHYRAYLPQQPRLKSEI